MPLFYLYVFHRDVAAIKDWRASTIVFLLTRLVTLLKLIGAFIPAVIYSGIKARHALMLRLLLNIQGVIELIDHHPPVEK